MECLLTEPFNQDHVEEYFGQQRSIGKRGDNPTVHQFGYNTNIILTQRFVATRTGNTSGNYKGLRKGSSWHFVYSEPLKKTKKEITSTKLINPLNKVCLQHNHLQ